MTRRPMMVIVAVVAVVGLMCGGMVVLPLVMFGLTEAEAAACEVSVPGAPVPGTGSWDGTQAAHAAAIVSAGAAREVPPRRSCPLERRARCRRAAGCCGGRA